MREVTEQRLIIILLLALLIQSLFLCTAVLLAVEQAAPEEHLKAGPDRAKFLRKNFSP